MGEVQRTRVLLLVEDSAGDAALVEEYLAGSTRDTYQIVRASRLDAAIAALRATAVDVVLLDLRLPDSAGVETVRALRSHAPEVPIVVLTGVNDERLSLECIDAGAQDFLDKSEVRAHNLRRAIGYALTRTREAQLRELQASLDRYRAMSSAAQGTQVTAALAGSGAVALRDPAAFARMSEAYFALLEPFLGRRSERVEAPRDTMERIVTSLGDYGGGPRDLLDLHVAALDRAVAQNDGPRALSVVVEARLLALEMMGLLVDYYRVGQRRRFK